MELNCGEITGQGGKASKETKPVSAIGDPILLRAMIMKASRAMKEGDPDQSGQPQNAPTG